MFIDAYGLTSCNIPKIFFMATATPPISNVALSDLITSSRKALLSKHHTSASWFDQICHPTSQQNVSGCAHDKLIQNQTWQKDFRRTCRIFERHWCWEVMISHVKSIGKHVESLTCRVPTLRPLFVKTEPTGPTAPKKEPRTTQLQKLSSHPVLAGSDSGGSGGLRVSQVHLSQIKLKLQTLHLYASLLTVLLTYDNVLFIGCQPRVLGHHTLYNKAVSPNAKPSPASKTLVLAWPRAASGVTWRNLGCPTFTIVLAPSSAKSSACGSVFWDCFGIVLVMWQVQIKERQNSKPWIIVKSRLIKWRHIEVQMVLIGRDITWHPIGKLAGTHKQHATKWHIDPALPSEWYGRRKYQTFRSWPGMHSFWFWFAHRPLTNHRRPEKTNICWNTII